ncbi:hypothetical protein ALC56_03770 [Trachymyrmex septentrionalis]|uniref:Uncharacterized protein n=1 Tax=Trachymyrmex septentrionalis TaxID=34720 RepID=A0A195FMC6_9HYME|nr:hypothetical protein ALC56_03770 [Trachymyrmex septentrionalis]
MYVCTRLGDTALPEKPAVSRAATRFRLQIPLTAGRNAWITPPPRTAPYADFPISLARKFLGWSKNPDICTIVNTLRLPQKEDRRNFKLFHATPRPLPPSPPRLILHPSRNSGRSDLSARTAREISGRSGLATLEQPSLFLVMLFELDQARSTDARDP